MSKFDIRPQIESQKGFRMSKWDIRPEIECHNWISNVKMRYSARIRMPKQDFECPNSINGPNVNVKIRLRMSKCEKKVECQNRISNKKHSIFGNVRIS